VAKLGASISNNPSLKKNRRKLRTNGTAAEAVLWTHLQKRQIEGKRFRRQFGIGPYIVDFYCPECGLVVELDGAPHYTLLCHEREAKRTKYLLDLGLRVIRVENKILYKNPEAVLETIRQACASTGE